MIIREETMTKMKWSSWFSVIMMWWRITCFNGIRNFKSWHSILANMKQTLCQWFIHFSLLMNNISQELGNTPLWHLPRIDVPHTSPVFREHTPNRRGVHAVLSVSQTNFDSVTGPARPLSHGPNNMDTVHTWIAGDMELQRVISDIISWLFSNYARMHVTTEQPMKTTLSVRAVAKREIMSANRCSYKN